MADVMDTTREGTLEQLWFRRRPWRGGRGRERGGNGGSNDEYELTLSL